MGSQIITNSSGERACESRPPVRLHISPEPTQLDFSSLPGSIGLEWSSGLDRRLVTPSALRNRHITMLRVRRGAYGVDVTGGQQVQTGGLEQEMTRMDCALARDFPITVHVMHHAEGKRDEYQLSEPDWKGRIVVHPTNLLRGEPESLRARIFGLIDLINPSLVHIHHPWDPIDWDIIAHIPRQVPVVASYHGASLGAVSPWKGQALRHAASVLRKTLAYYDAERHSGASPLQALTSTGRRIVDCLGRTRMAERCCREVAQRAEACPYDSVAITAVSEAAQHDLRAVPSCVVPPPVDPDFFSRQAASTDNAHRVLRALGIPQGAILMTYHARMCYEKGQHILPQVAAQLKERTDVPCVFLLVGPESQPGMFQILLRDIAGRGVKDRVFILPGVDQPTIRDLLAVTDISVFPTFDEGLGLTAVEAAMMELPVVAHRVGGVPEVVIDQVNGRLVVANDINGFVAALQALLSNPTLRAQYGTKGREMMQRRFSPSACAQKYLQQVCLPLILGSAQRDD
jgi:glycosyltransferase involved in cell wall biosynthesis